MRAQVRGRGGKQDHSEPRTHGFPFLHYNGPYELYDGLDLLVTQFSPTILEAAAA